MSDPCSASVVLGCSSERRLGDLEVALTLEDLGPIVQPTVQLEAAEQKLVSRRLSISLKSFPTRKAHWAALISISLALSQTPVYTARPLHGVPVYAQPSLVLNAPTHEGMARLS